MSKVPDKAEMARNTADVAGRLVSNHKGQFGLVCKRCQKVAAEEDTSGTDASRVDALVRSALGLGWHVEEGKWICGNCVVN
jgi:hypothetical protein